MGVPVCAHIHSAGSSQTVSGWPCQQYVTVTLQNYKNNTHTSTIDNTDRQDAPDTTPGAATEWVTATGLPLSLSVSHNIMAFVRHLTHVFGFYFSALICHNMLNTIPLAILVHLQ